MNTLQILGQRLKSLRQEKNKSQQDMSDVLQMSQRNYQRIEYGEINLQALTLCALADYFGVTTDYLLGRSEKRN